MSLLGWLKLRTWGLLAPNDLSAICSVLNKVSSFMVNLLITKGYVYCVVYACAVGILLLECFNICVLASKTLMGGVPVDPCVIHMGSTFFK